MTFTNRNNLPEVLVRALTNDSYQRDDSDFTVTELLKLSRQRQLEIIHKDEIEEDVSDRLWSMFGQMGHLLLERSGTKNEITEVRFKAVFFNLSLSAQVDSVHLAGGVLTDWKFTTAFKFMANKPMPEDYVWQLNIQKRILELQRKPIKVKSLQIGGMLRDWKVRDALKDKNYPQTPICLMPIPVKSKEETEAYILNRMTSHYRAQEDLPLCPKEQLWGGIRCQSYCRVNKFCTQYNGGKNGSKKRGDIISGSEVSPN